jgi:Transposase IS116/IS110/IS902 family
LTRARETARGRAWRPAIRRPRGSRPDRKFEAQIRELVAGYPDLAAIVEPLLVARRVLREQLGILHRQLLAVVRRNEVCRRLMTMPGVGPVVALTFRATIDVPARFTSSRSVGAVFGLTPRRHQSGEIDRMGGISKCGDGSRNSSTSTTCPLFPPCPPRRGTEQAALSRASRVRGLRGHSDSRQDEALNETETRSRMAGAEPSKRENVLVHACNGCGFG